MEPAGSLPCSQEPVIGPCPEPDASNPHYHLNIILPCALRFSEWCLLFKHSDQNLVCLSHLSRACYMSHPSRPWRDRPNDILWSVQVMKLFIM